MFKKLVEISLNTVGTQMASIVFVYISKALAMTMGGAFLPHVGVIVKD